jgi:hypothetical protein
MSITSLNNNNSSASTTDRSTFSLSSAAVESWTRKNGLFIFIIRVKSSSEWILEKSLSNFEDLRKSLITSNKNIVKFPFPQTRYLLLSTMEAMDERRYKLDLFLTEVLKLDPQPDKICKKNFNQHSN